MLASTRWLLRLLGPQAAHLSSEALQSALIDAGFPIESATPLDNGDTRLDVEITSNRGDCLSHLGLAREIAAHLKLPAPTPRGSPAPSKNAEPIAKALTLESRVGDACPRFTARVVRGVKVGPSPAWLREALESVGQRSISNVVDATNYLNLELGQPCHAFDLARLSGSAIVVRTANEGEALTTLDGKARTLKRDEIVVADAQRAQSLAGVMGGRDSEVTDATRDVVLEVATWDPVAVRRASRRHQLRTDASHRYERLVDARAIDAAADRLAALVIEIAGGTMCEGSLAVGPALPAPTRLRVRPSRVRDVLGVEVPDSEMVGALERLDVRVLSERDVLVCTIPPQRPDLTREIDLIEEIARVVGLAQIPTRDRVGVLVRPPQERERARRELAGLLAGMGFYEAITFSFCSRKEGALFMPPTMQPVEVDDERRKAEPMLRPSVLSGLLACRRANQNAQPTLEACRFFEVASVFAQQPGSGPLPDSLERTNLALAIDVPNRSRSGADIQLAVRTLRGTIESLVRSLAGAGADLAFSPQPSHAKAFDAGAYARVSLGGLALGFIALISREAQSMYDLAGPMVVAELDFDRLLAAFPPRARVTPLPAFPGIERDVSFVLDEGVAWSRVEERLASRRTPEARLKSWRFVGTFRGAQIGPGKKSVTVRFAFRDPSRTLRHEEVDGDVSGIVEDLKQSLGATVRG